MAVSRTKQRSRTSRQIARTARGHNDDRPLVSKPPYTLIYLRKRFAKASQIQIAHALEECTNEIKTDDPQQIMNCLKLKLGAPLGLKGDHMATNKMRKRGESKSIQGRQGGGGQQAGGNKLRGKTGTAGGQKKRNQSREVGSKGGGRG
jgi:hypothetical protein